MSHELSQSEARIKETARAAAEASEQSASQVRQSEFWFFFHVFHVFFFLGFGFSSPHSSSNLSHLNE
jgi:hypothetical protein